MNMECGGSTPLFSGQPRLPDTRKPRLAEQSGAESPHSTPDGAESPHSTPGNIKGTK